METAWAMLVVSSEAQAETLSHQRDWAAETCAFKGWHLSRTLQGVSSGRNGPRRLSQELLLELRAQPPDVRPTHLLMTRLDRIGRGSIIDSQIFIRDLFVLGVRVFTRDQGEMRLDSAMDELIAAVQMAVARHENDVKRDKMHAVYRRRRAAGQVVSNRTAYGIAITPDRRYEVVPDYEPALRRAFEMRVAGIGLTAIGRWLQENAPVQRFKNGNTRIVHWNDDRTSELIANRQYCGSAVDEATWLKAQRVARYAGRHPRQVRKHGEFPLGGLLRCECGRGIQSSAKFSHRRRNVTRKYVCRATWNHVGKYVYHSAESCEDKFVEMLRKATMHPETMLRRRRFGFHAATLSSVVKNQASLQDKLSKLDKARERAWRLDESGRVSEFDVASRLADLGKKRRLLEMRLVELIGERRLMESAAQEDAETERLFRTAFDDYIGGDVTTKSAIARAVVIATGGVRIALDGTLIFGTGRDVTPHNAKRPRYGDSTFPYTLLTAADRLT